jgi:hypothetical protein
MPAGMLSVFVGVLSVFAGGVGSVAGVVDALSVVVCAVAAVVCGLGGVACAEPGMGATANMIRPATARLGLLRLPDCPPRAIRWSHRDPSTIVFMRRTLLAKYGLIKALERAVI